MWKIMIINRYSLLKCRVVLQRFSVFKWMAGVVATIEFDKLKPILFHFMSPLVREMATIEESNAPLRQLAKGVATMIKKKLGVEEYTGLLSKAQRRLDTRRAEKKKVRLQQVNIEQKLTDVKLKSYSFNSKEFIKLSFIIFTKMYSLLLIITITRFYEI